MKALDIEPEERNAEDQLLAAIGWVIREAGARRPTLSVVREMDDDGS